MAGELKERLGETWRRSVGMAAYEPVVSRRAKPDAARSAFRWAILGPLGVIALLEAGTVEQLSDVFSPSTANVAGVGAIRLGPSSWLPHGILGERVFPYGWLAMWAVALGVAYLLLRSFARVCWLVGNEPQGTLPQPALHWQEKASLRRSRWSWLSWGHAWLARRAPGLQRVWDRAREALGRWVLPLPASTRTPWARWWRAIKLAPLGELVGYGDEGNLAGITGVSAFKRLWWGVFLGIPLCFIAGALLVVGGTLLQGGEITPQPVALGFGLSLLLTVVESVALYRLGEGLGLRSFGKSIVLVPYLVLFALLFARITWFPDTAYADGKPGGALAPVEEVRPPSDDGAFPLVGLALSGGGSRAALFTAGSLGELWWCGLDRKRLPHLEKGLDPVERDLVFPPDESGRYYPGRLALLRADFLSSVSGGSLAAAYLTEAVAQKATRDRLGGSPRARRARALAALFPRPDNTLRDLWAEIVGLEAEHRRKSGDRALETRLDDRTDALIDRLEEPLPGGGASFVGAMAGDHLGAVIAGFAQFWLGRGPGIERYWERQLRWPKADGAEGRVSWLAEPEREGLVPHLLLNTTRVRDGGRVAIANLDGRFFTPMRMVGPLAFGKSDRFDAAPGKVTLLRELLPKEDISLARAVRASSNFPFGFPLMEFANGREVELTDGGVLDNTGLDTLMAILRDEDVRKRTPRAFVLQIDSGELAGDKEPSRFDLLDHHFSATRAAMWRAGQYAGAQAIASAILELQAMFGPANASPAGEPGYIAGVSGARHGFYRIRLGETKGDHIPTSWHLSRTARGRLYRQLKAPTVQKAIRKAAEDIGRLAEAAYAERTPR